MLPRESRSRRPSSRTRTGPPRIRTCYFCSNAINDIDFKDVRLLQRFISSYAKISPRKRTGTCAFHQRDLSQAIKRARYLALLPFAVR